MYLQVQRRGFDWGRGSVGLVIAGFHRSGTSSITQHLTASGMNPGNDLIGANEYNTYGHFEDWGPVRFHDAVLKAAGFDWASVTRDKIPMNAEHKGYIRNYCAERAAETSTWGFKDPRVCQFVDEWMEIDPTLNVLIVYRSPVECSWSIYRRTVREFVHETHDRRIDTRIMKQSDHAVALWVTHNRKLLEVAARFPERMIVVSHEAFTSGFNVAASLREHFGFSLTPVDVGQTFRAEAVTRQVAPLAVADSTLHEEAIEIWNSLQRLDVAYRNRGENVDLPFCNDPTGLIFANQLLSIEVSETRKLIKQFSINSADNVEVKLKAQKVARKLQRWPFSIFFKRSKKYRQLIEEILS